MTICAISFCVSNLSLALSFVLLFTNVNNSSSSTHILWPRNRIAKLLRINIEIMSKFKFKKQQKDGFAEKVV